MANVFARAAEMIGRRLKSAAGVSVTYSRASTGQSVTLTAWVGRTLFSSVNEGGPAVEWGDRDYLIPAADLKLGGVATEPAEADRIAETIGGTATAFQVCRPDTGEPAWRWSDPQRTCYRVHCKRVG